MGRHRKHSACSSKQAMPLRRRRRRSKRTPADNVSATSSMHPRRILEVEEMQVSIGDLPETILLKIFSYLEPVTVANVVNRVCSQWHCLASDWDLWRHVTLEYHCDPVFGVPFTFKQMAQILNTAPYLKKFDWRSPILPENDLPHVLTSTSCIFQSLCIDKMDFPVLVNTVKNQSANLLKLELCLGDPVCKRTGKKKFAIELCEKLWHSISEMKMLEELNIEDIGPVAYVPFAFEWPKAQTLKSLRLVSRYKSSLNSQPIVSCIYAHTNTLTDVSLIGNCVSPAVFEAIGHCTNLKKCSLSVGRGISYLSACKQLQIVHLQGNAMQNNDLPDLISFFINLAGTIEILHLNHFSIDLYRIFFRSVGGGHMKYLSLKELFIRDSIAEVEELPPAIGGLPCLEVLRFEWLPSSVTLEHIGMYAASCLRELKVAGSCKIDFFLDDQNENYGCRFPALRRLLENRPILQVSGLGHNRKLCASDHRYYWCSEGIYTVYVNHVCLPALCNICSQVHVINLSSHSLNI